MSVVPRFRHIERTIASLVGGMTGAVVGALAGPGAIVFGSIFGAWVGFAAGTILEEEQLVRSRKERRLDETLGRNMGAAHPDPTPIASSREPIPAELRRTS